MQQFYNSYRWVIPTDGYLGKILIKVVESLVSDGYFFIYSMIRPTIIAITVKITIRIS